MLDVVAIVSEEHNAIFTIILNNRMVVTLLPNATDHVRRLHGVSTR
jgi:hypothetical protein